MPSALKHRVPEVYVLWHPACLVGEAVARHIYQWLRPTSGLGPRVFYRNLPAPHAPVGGLPLPVQGEIWRAAPAFGPSTPGHDRIFVILVLVDENMIADPAWRHWLLQLASPESMSSPCWIIPVALDATAFNVPAPLRKLNFLRPAGLPLPGPEEAHAPARDLVVRSLLKQLTEALCRFMLAEEQGSGSEQSTQVTAIDGVTKKVKIFLSHAKLDGKLPARLIRDYIYSQTQMAAFYDENDIPYGSDFGGVLQDNLKPDETAALIAVRGSRYADRPWCRRELSLFRRPMHDARVPGSAEHWRLNPVLVVDAMEGGEQSPGIPELGNSPLIRWGQDVTNQEERIVTTLLRDVLLSAVSFAVGLSIPDGSDSIVLNWVPDPISLLQIPRIRAGDELKVYYPGRGLTWMELRGLEESFLHLEFHSFQEVLS